MQQVLPNCYLIGEYPGGPPRPGMPVRKGARVLRDDLHESRFETVAKLMLEYPAQRCVTVGWHLVHQFGRRPPAHAVIRKMDRNGLREKNPRSGRLKERRSYRSDDHP